MALAGHAGVGFAGGSHAPVWTLLAGSEQRRLEPEACPVANHSFAVREAASAGLGIARLPRLVAAPALADGTPVPILPQWEASPVPAHAICASARCLTPKVRAFLDLAVAAFAEV